MHEKRKEYMELWQEPRETKACQNTEGELGRTVCQEADKEEHGL